MLINTDSFRPKYQQVLNQVIDQMNTLRTGKASIQMLDSVNVEAYGSYMKIAEVASISTPDPTLIVIKPWDKSLLQSIEKGIEAAQLNLNAIVDKDLIRVPVPPLTQERREEMVKILHQKEESGKVLMRSVRAEARKEIEQQEGTSAVSEDDIQQNLEELDKLTTEFIEKLEEMVDKKEKELLSI